MKKIILMLLFAALLTIPAYVYQAKDAFGDNVTLKTVYVDEANYTEEATYIDEDAYTDNPAYEDNATYVDNATYEDNATYFDEDQ